MIEAKGLDTALQALSMMPNGVKRAANAAINKTARGAKTDISRKISKEYYVTSGTVRKTLDMKRSNLSSLSATIVSQGSVIPLSKFKVTPGGVQHRGSHNKPIKVAVKRGGKKTLSRNAFVAQFASGHKAVVERVSEKRYPLQQKYGPAIPSMLKNAQVNEPIMELAKERFEKNFSHEVERILKGYGK